MLKIKEFSSKVNFSIRMLRYLEEMSLLTPKRDSSNYRVYTTEDIKKANKIKKLQKIGLQLKEIESILDSSSRLNFEQKLKAQVLLLTNVLEREQEIAEIKSDSIPELKNIIDWIRNHNKDLNSYLLEDKKPERKFKTLAGEEKFQRTAYNIPILKNIYEDHLTADADINLIATDLLKFGEWFEETDYLPSVYSVLKETSFVFGNNITGRFIEGYERSWKKFLPEMGFKNIEGFEKSDISQLMGIHDIIIRSTFSYQDTGLNGEIIIPYAPIYTMVQLSHR